LATPANRARPGSYFEMELDYLKTKGYQVSKDCLKMMRNQNQ
jgi:hypothetical protein